MIGAKAMTKYELVPAQPADLPVCMDILNAGREFQRAQGFVQWPDGYPPQADVAEDIRIGNGYVVKVDGCIAAYLYIGFDGDPAYPAIKGAWHHVEPYAVIHRLAIGTDFRGTGLTPVLFSLAEDFCRERGIFNLRIDTDEQNRRMRHVLEKNGFVYCGTVIQGGGDRLAFDKALR